MILLDGIEITNFTVDEWIVNWTIESTTEDITTYELNLYRSEHSPQNDVTTNMTLVASGIAAEDYAYTNTISGYQYSQHRQFYYAAEPVLESTQATGTVIGPETVIAVPDFVTKAARRHQSAGFRMTGQPVSVLKKRTFGTFCTNCFDSTTGRKTQTNCLTCYDTSFEGGYFGEIIVSGIMNPAPKRQMLTDWGAWQPMDAIVTLEQYPVVVPNDIIVDRLNRRWAVIEMRPTQKGLSLITQKVQVRVVPKNDIIYDVPVSDLRDYD